MGQVGYKNYVGSMGAGFEGWLVGDRVVTPPDYAMVCPGQVVRGPPHCAIACSDLGHAGGEARQTRR